MKKHLCLIPCILLLHTQMTFGFRDLETGTFLTRDPIGYADGPNMYCYVHCNPITYFDAFGLKFEPVGGDDFKDEVWEELDVIEKKLESAVEHADDENREEFQKQYDRFIEMKYDENKVVRIENSASSTYLNSLNPDTVGKNTFWGDEDAETGDPNVELSYIFWNPDFDQLSEGQGKHIQNGDLKMKSGEALAHEIGHAWDHGFDGSPGVEVGDPIPKEMRDMYKKSEVDSLGMENAVRYGTGKRSFFIFKSYNNDRKRFRYKKSSSLEIDPETGSIW